MCLCSISPLYRQDDIIDGGEETKREAKCGHCFHDDCIRAYIADAPKLKSGGVGCPVCFTKLHIELDADDDEEPSTQQHTTKGGMYRQRGMEGVFAHIRHIMQLDGSCGSTE